MGATKFEEMFRARLEPLPNLICVRFHRTSVGVTPALIDIVLKKVPRLEIDWSARWLYNGPIQADRIYTVPNTLTHLSYEPFTWRDSLTGQALEAQFALESRYLVQLLCGMHANAQSLLLPMESAPLAAMSELPWPNIRDLSLRGQYPANLSERLFPEFLIRVLPQLQSLCVRAAPQNTLPRPPILGPSMTSESITLPDLRSLTVAYPDPADAIFNISAPRLTHLSLCDQPRYYYARGVPEHVPDWFAAPILRASECLGILQRMETPLLESIELVYQADTAEDDLLRHLATYPRLEIVELHRYREHDPDPVPYVSISMRAVVSSILTRTQIHVVTALSAISCLRRLYLNLDFQEMPPVRDKTLWRHTWNARPWIDFRNAQAQEFLKILQSCPRFEYLALLDPRLVCATWVEYRPAWSHVYDWLFDMDVADLLRAYVIHSTSVFALI